jgi:hypothetical protein
VTEKASWLSHYDARQLSIDSGEVLAVTERDSDWIRVVTDDGRPGWVPATRTGHAHEARIS